MIIQQPRGTDREHMMEMRSVKKKLMRMKNGKLKIDYKPVELTSWQSWFMSLTTGWVTFTECFERIQRIL